MNLRPGFKEEGLVIFISKFLLKLGMNGPPPLCRECGGRFICPLIGNWCAICSLLGRLRIHIYSDRFPSACSAALESTLRETLWRILEVSDTYWAANPNLQAPPPAPPGEGVVQREEEKKGEETAKTDTTAAKEEEEPAAPATSAKSAPPKPKALAVKVEPSKELDKSPLEEVHPEEPSRSEKSKSRRARKKRSRGDREGRSRSRKRRRRRRESSKSREDSEPPRSTGKEKRVAEPATPPLRPRSPSRPPHWEPQGSASSSRWRGPIPAYRREHREQGRERDQSPKYTNKGNKKRKQQANVRKKGKGKGSSYWRR